MDKERIELIEYIINGLSEQIVKVVNDVLTKFIDIETLIKFIKEVVDFRSTIGYGKKLDLLTFLENFMREDENEKN